MHTPHYSELSEVSASSTRLEQTTASQPANPDAAGSYFVLSMFDKLWRPELTEADALEMMEKGVAEVRKRLIVSCPGYEIKVVDKDGIRTLKKV